MRYLGNIIHDCWASYLPYGHCNHGLCGSHLLRELTFIIEANGYAWARNMKRLLQEACVEVSKNPEKKLQAKQLANLQKRYRNILTRALKNYPLFPSKPPGSVANWQNQMRIIFWSGYNGMRHRYCVSPRNHPFCLRITELSVTSGCQKLSKRFRVLSVRRLCQGVLCRISSYLQTMANKGYNPLIAVQLALAGKFDV